MGTKRFPDLHLISRYVTIGGAWRIIPKEFKDNPLGTGYGDGRFSAPNREYKILYAASSFKTAIRETLIRDEFNNNKSRVLSAGALNACACVVIDSTLRLNLLDLNDGNPNSIGVPTAFRQSTNYDESRAFALEIFREMPEIDGFYYRSRLDDELCFAIFEQSVRSKLRAIKTMLLTNNPNLRTVLQELRMKSEIFEA